MNRLLFRAEELDSERQIQVEPRVAQHLTKVLRVAVGQQLRAAVVGEGTCTAEVLGVASTAATVRLSPVVPVAPPSLSLVLALPRPKALSRAVQVAASFGLRELVLINSWRVDASYFQSHKLELAQLQQDAYLGCEQGCQVHLPAISVHRYFAEFVQACLVAGRAREPHRRWIVAHPGATDGIETVARGGDTIATTLVLGPDGGFIQREVDTFQRCGAALAHGGSAILRTEAAVAALLSQLQLLGRLGLGVVT